MSTSPSIRELLAVLEHPEHAAGLHKYTMTVTSLARRAENLMRVSVALPTTVNFDEWNVPNPTIRIEIPESPAELAGVEGAPQTTSRVYTVSEVNQGVISIDIVVHPEPSPAMRWLSSLSCGDRVDIVGPRAHRVPGPGSPRVLLADSSALPAAMRILRTMPVDDNTLLVAAVPDDEFALLMAEKARFGSDIEFQQVDPHGGTPLSRAFVTMQLPESVSVWASGERDDVRLIRARCKDELGLPKERMQVFGYWKRGITHTSIDLARLQATHEVLARGGSMLELDDFEIAL